MGREHVLEQLVEQNTKLTAQNTKLTAQNEQQAEEIIQLKQQIADLKSTVKRKSRKSRSYNTREFKEYPRPDGYSKRKRPEDIGYKAGMQVAVQQTTVDLKYCPIHGVRYLAKLGSSLITHCKHDCIMTIKKSLFLQCNIPTF